MYPILFNFETYSISIHTYGIIIYLTFVLAYMTIKKNFIRFGLNHPGVKLTIAIFSIIIFSRLVASPFSPHTLYDGKFNFFGGLIGFFIAILITKKDEILSKILDISSVSICITYIGSSLANILDAKNFYGSPSNAPWPLAIVIEQAESIRVGSSVWAIGYFAMINGLIAYYLSKKKYHTPGFKFTTVILFLSVNGYIIEQFRGDSTIFTQWSAIICILMSLVLLTIFHFSFKKELRKYES